MFFADNKQDELNLFENYAVFISKIQWNNYTNMLTKSV